MPITKAQSHIKNANKTHNKICSICNDVKCRTEKDIVNHVLLCEKENTHNTQKNKNVQNSICFENNPILQQFQFITDDYLDKQNEMQDNLQTVSGHNTMSSGQIIPISSQPSGDNTMSSGQTIPTTSQPSGNNTKSSSPNPNQNFPQNIFQQTKMNEQIIFQNNIQSNSKCVLATSQNQNISESFHNITSCLCVNHEKNNQSNISINIEKIVCETIQDLSSNTESNNKTNNVFKRNNTNNDIGSNQNSYENIPMLTYDSDSSDGM